MVTKYRALEVSTSGYWAWLNRAPCGRPSCAPKVPTRLLGQHRISRRVYGSPRYLGDLA